MAKKDPNTIMKPGESYSKGTFGPVTDLADIPGQGGYTTNLEYYHAAADYTRRPVIPFLMEAPAGFQDLNDPDKRVAALKALIELHPRRITGLDQSLEVEYVSTPFGAAGEEMETLAKVKRARSQPQFEWVEKIGTPVKWFWQDYIINLLGNPDTNVPAVVARGRNTPYGLYPDYTAFTVLFVEPDPTQKYVVEAWLCTNMMPRAGAKIEGSRDITETPENITHSIGFTCLQQVGAGVRKLGQQLLDTANQTGIDPSQRRAWLQAIEADVKSADTGYLSSMTAAKNQMV